MCAWNPSTNPPAASATELDACVLNRRKSLLLNSSTADRFIELNGFSDCDILNFPSFI